MAHPLLKWPCSGLGHAKLLFGWAAEEDLIEHSPAAPLKGSSLIGEKKPRQRVLIDAELSAVWRASGRLGYPFGPLLQFLILTGARKTEGSGARWSEIDLEAGLWTIPASRFKANSTHLVPLTDDAVRSVASLAPLRCRRSPVFHDAEEFPGIRFQQGEG